MSKILKEISCVVGQYENAQGEKKQRYQRIGSIIDTKNGPMLKLDNVPLVDGGWNGWAYINDPKPRDDQQSAPMATSKRKNDFHDDDLPF